MSDLVGDTAPRTASSDLHYIDVIFLLLIIITPNLFFIDLFSDTDAVAVASPVFIGGDKFDVVLLPPIRFLFLLNKDDTLVLARDVDFDKVEFQIARRVDVYGDEGATKSWAGVRGVPLSGQLVAMLKAWKLKSKFSKLDDLIFPNREGGYVGHDNLIKRRFLPLFDALEAKHRKEPDRFPPAPARFNWHGLRHFAVSCWIEAGLAPKTVQTFAGHASLQVTMDRYGHLFPSDDHRKAMDQIAKGLFD